MKQFFILSLFLGLLACKSHKPTISNKEVLSSDIEKYDFSIAFGSGDNQRKTNNLWDDIILDKPDVWIWGGDNIYCDTEDMNVLEKCYATQKNKPTYQNFINTIEIQGVWDDHDYGMNDGGAEYPKKTVSQALYLDFFDVPDDDIRRKRNGTYYSKDYNMNEHTIKIILLDTRYFRTALTEDTETRKRYKPNVYGEGTMLGEVQWKWLSDELINSKADFNIIVSSIQFLSNQHGFEAWGTMPHEVDKMENLIVSSQAKNVIILSGDRHISEISQKIIGTKKFPLIDFTSSGLTHSYASFSGETNPYRVSKVVFQKSYGLVKFNFESKKVAIEMRGDNRKLFEKYLMQY
jgi:alkaline phosphatase D